MTSPHLLVLVFLIRDQHLHIRLISFLIWCSIVGEQFWCPSSSHHQILFPLSDQYVTNRSIPGAHLPVQTQSNLAGAFPPHCSALLTSSWPQSWRVGGVEGTVRVGSRGIIEVGEEQAVALINIYSRDERSSNKAWESDIARAEDQESWFRTWMERMCSSHYHLENRCCTVSLSVSWPPFWLEKEKKDIWLETL